MLIIGTLFIMIVLSFFNVFLGNSFVQYETDSSFDASALINGTSTSYEVTGTEVIFNIDAIEGAITIILTIVIIAVILGIQILGSGLSDSAVRIGTYCSVYVGLWGVLTVLSADLVWDIEVFGGVIYIALTIIYTIGVVQKIAEG